MRRYNNRYNSRASFERLINTKPKYKSNLVSDSYKSNVQGWRTLDNRKYYFKSLWEINYACYLNWLKANKQILEWEYEPRIFNFPKEPYNTGPFTYKPDFKVTGLDGIHVWHEVKGYMTNDAKKKKLRFEKHYPNEMLYIVGQKEMAEIAKFRALIPGWETYNFNL